MQIRLFVNQPLAVGATVCLAESQLHYLRNVLRAEPGAELFVFNGRDGEFAAVLSVLNKKRRFRSAAFCAASRKNAMCVCILRR